jgi:thiol-disulfide isomerase/thioredoxin
MTHQPGEERPDQKPPRSRYPTLVGLVFLAVVVYATLNTIRTQDDGILGSDAGERGAPLQEFAVPDVRADLSEQSALDANIFQDDCETGDNPCPADRVRTPACRIESADAIRVCALFDRPLAISFWFTRGADCLPTQDAFDAAATEYEGRVNFLSVNVRDELEEVQRIVRERGWQVPVGWDRDGAVSNIYRVGVCPTIAFAYPGGILHEARIGSEELAPEALRAELDDLIRASEARAEVR